MSLKTVATPAFLAQNLTPLDMEMVLELTQEAASRSKDVRLTIRDESTCIRLACEATPPPVAPPIARIDLRSVA